jgi:hypothetical protein
MYTRTRRPFAGRHRDGHVDPVAHNNPFAHASPNNRPYADGGTCPDSNSGRTTSTVINDPGRHRCNARRNTSMLLTFAPSPSCSDEPATSASSAPQPG